MHAIHNMLEFPIIISLTDDYVEKEFRNFTRNLEFYSFAR